MSSFDKLNELNLNVKQNIDRHTSLEKKIKDVVRVTKDPDKWNANIASRDRVDALEEKVNTLLKRVEGLSYLVKQVVKEKR